MSARIFSPAKTAMQSGKAKTGHWVLEFDPESRKKIDPLMGYTTSGDMRSQIRLTFDTRDPRASGWKRWNPSDSRRQVALPGGRQVTATIDVDAVTDNVVSFTIEQIYGGWNREPVGAADGELLVIARA